MLRTGMHVRGSDESMIELVIAIGAAALAWTLVTTLWVDHRRQRHGGGPAVRAAAAGMLPDTPDATASPKRARDVATGHGVGSPELPTGPGAWAYGPDWIELPDAVEDEVIDLIDLDDFALREPADPGDASR